MSGNSPRALTAILVLSTLLSGAVPNTVLAQSSCIDLCNVVAPQVTGPEEPPASAPIVSYEAYGNPVRRFFREGEWYFSWGYSRESWARTNIHVSQHGQGNDFTIYDVKGIDDPSWGSFFAAQFNIRFGRFIDEARTLAVEFNLDHTKYSSVTNQLAHVNGTIAGKPIDANMQLDRMFFDYNLHNGANHIMINLFKRVPLIGETNENFSVAGIFKAGVGVMLPHADNVVLGHSNNIEVGGKELRNLVGFNRGWWRADGWTTGIEAGVRIVLAYPLYLEITDKIAYANLYGIPVFQGSARHNLWMNEVIVSVGITFGGR